MAGKINFITNNPIIDQNISNANIKNIKTKTKHLQYFHE